MTNTGRHDGEPPLQKRATRLHFSEYSYTKDSGKSDTSPTIQLAYSVTLGDLEYSKGVIPCKCISPLFEFRKRMCTRYPVQ